jgi:hypothetical protein
MEYRTISAAPLAHVLKAIEAGTDGPAHRSYAERTAEPTSYPMSLMRRGFTYGLRQIGAPLQKSTGTGSRTPYSLTIYRGFPSRNARLCSSWRGQGQ